jgi:DNA-directed RNA polymerase sigma subunit (sigma70/sigma32)
VDDLYAEARAGFVIAAARFDPSRGVRFGTYAVWWARARLARFLRRESAGGLHVPADHGWVPLPVASLDAGRLADSIEGRAGPAAPGGTPGWWDWALGGLPARERDMLLPRFRDGLTLGAVGRRYGISRERVRQVTNKALATLRGRRPDLADERPT